MNRKRKPNYIQNSHILLLFIWITLLVVLHFPAQYLFDTARAVGPDYLYYLFDLDNEKSLATWTSQALLLLSGVAILYNYSLPKIRYVIAAVLVLMSIDESVSLHEKLMNFFGDQGVTPSGLLSFSWLIVDIPVAILLLAGLYAAYQKTKPLLSGQFFLGFIIFLTGAVGMEAVNGLSLGNATFYSVVMVGLEETLELLGLVLIFISATRWLTR